MKLLVNSSRDRLWIHHVRGREPTPTVEPTRAAPSSFALHVLVLRHLSASSCCAVAPARHVPVVVVDAHAADPRRSHAIGLVLVEVDSGNLATSAPTNRLPVVQDGRPVGLRERTNR